MHESLLSDKTHVSCQIVRIPLSNDKDYDSFSMKKGAIDKRLCQEQNSSTFDKSFDSCQMMKTCLLSVDKGFKLNEVIQRSNCGHVHRHETTEAQPRREAFFEDQA